MKSNKILLGILTGALLITSIGVSMAGEIEDTSTKRSKFSNGETIKVQRTEYFNLNE